MTNEVYGELIIDKSESRSLEDVDLHHIPEPMDREYKDCIEAYIKEIS